MIYKLELFFYMEKKLKSNSNQKEDPLPYVTEKSKSSAALTRSTSLSFSLSGSLFIHSQTHPPHGLASGTSRLVFTPLSSPSIKRTPLPHQLQKKSKSASHWSWVCFWTHRRTNYSDWLDSGHIPPFGTHQSHMKWEWEVGSSHEEKGWWVL